jgi:hypothetical protein
VTKQVQTTALDQARQDKLVADVGDQYGRTPEAVRSMFVTADISICSREIRNFSVDISTLCSPPTNVTKLIQPTVSYRARRDTSVADVCVS